MPPRELAFISWAGLRGAVPIVLTTIPLAEGVTDSEQLFDIVFVLVVIYTVITGPTLLWVAKVLHVVRRSEPRGLDIEAGDSISRRPRSSGSPPTCCRSRSARSPRCTASRWASCGCLQGPRSR